MEVMQYSTMGMYSVRKPVKSSAVAGLGLSRAQKARLPRETHTALQIIMVL